MFATVFILLYTAHLFADYALQSDHQAEHKAGPGITGWCANLSHAATHVLVSAALLATGTAVLGLSLNGPIAVAALGWVGASHALLDRRWPSSGGWNTSAVRPSTRPAAAPPSWTRPATSARSSWPPSRPPPDPHPHPHRGRQRPA